MIYHFALVDQVENKEDAESQQENLDDHELQVMEVAN